MAIKGMAQAMRNDALDRLASGAAATTLNRVASRIIAKTALVARELAFGHVVSVPVSV